MKKYGFYKMVLATFMLCTSSGLWAQDSHEALVEEANKRITDYLTLSKMGYSDEEIYQDLGNVYFLAENYSNAIFWYEKLMEVKGSDLNNNYQERYQHALTKAQQQGTVVDTEQERDWFEAIKADYQLKNRLNPRTPKKPSKEELWKVGFKPVDELVMQSGDPVENLPYQDAYAPPMSITSDGQTAYFSKAVYQKPKVGVFSKKELVHRIYKAEYSNGEWINVQEVPVSPKHASAIHPTVSRDGKRIFFASNMPGSYGEYDIYVADIKADGSYGPAKNLGPKVNTEANDVYPNIVGNNSLVYATDGREGFGGLDMYTAQVGDAQVGRSINLGAQVNSGSDDFSIVLMGQRGMGYVMSNRDAASGQVRQLALRHIDTDMNSLANNGKYKPLDVVSGDNDFTTSENK